MTTHSEKMMKAFLGLDDYPNLTWLLGMDGFEDYKPEEIKKYGKSQGNADSHFPVKGHYISIRQHRRAYDIRHPRELEVEKFPKTGEYGKDAVRYNEAGQKVYENTSDAFRLWADNGQLIYEWVKSGENKGLRTWNEQGQMLFEEKPDGSATEWYDDGKKRSEWKPTVYNGKRWDVNEGHGHEWAADGSIIIEHNGNDIKKYDEKHRLILEQDYNGYKTYSYHGDTNIISHKHVYEGKYGDTLYREKLYEYQHFTPQGIEDTDAYLAKKLLAERRIIKEDMRKTSQGKRRIMSKMSAVAKYAKMRVAQKYIKNKRNDLKAFPKDSSER